MDPVAMHGLAIAAFCRITTCRTTLHRHDKICWDFDLGVLSSNEDLVYVGGFFSAGTYDLHLHGLVDLLGDVRGIVAAIAVSVQAG